MMASLLIILESHIIKKFVRQFLRDFIMYSNDEKTEFDIVIFGECRKILLKLHMFTLKDTQMGLVLKFLSTINFFQYFFL
jgi:hypothetical protein